MARTAARPSVNGVTPSYTGVRRKSPLGLMKPQPLTVSPWDACMDSTAALPSKNGPMPANLGATTISPDLLITPQLLPMRTEARPSENPRARPYCGLIAQLPFLSTKPQRPALSAAG